MHVLVSGAGIAGPTLAYFLARAGIHVTVVEKAKSVLAQGQNIDLTGGAITIARKMGVYDEVKRFNTGERGFQLIGTDGKAFAPFPVENGHSPTSEFEILRGDLANVLYNASKDHPDVRYMFGTTVQKVISNGENAVKVELSNGEVHDFDLLVAADGQWSKIRKESFAPEEVTVVDKDMYLAYFTVPKLPGDQPWWSVFHALRSRMVSIRPDPHGTMRVCLTMMPLSDAQRQEWKKASRSDRDTQEKLVRRDFADAGWQSERFLNDMERADDFYFQGVQQIKMERWSNSRVVLAGDTAHAPTPLTGMGTSLAIMGAYILAGELSSLKEGEKPFEALANYDKIFRPFVEKIQKIPSFIPGLMHPKSAWGRWLLQAGMSTVSKVLLMRWVGKKIGNYDPEQDTEGFVLPEYPAFAAQPPA